LGACRSFKIQERSPPTNRSLNGSLHSFLISTKSKHFAIFFHILAEANPALAGGASHGRPELTSYRKKCVARNLPTTENSFCCQAVTSSFPWVRPVSPCITSPSATVQCQTWAELVYPHIVGGLCIASTRSRGLSLFFPFCAIVPKSVVGETRSPNDFAHTRSYRPCCIQPSSSELLELRALRDRPSLHFLHKSGTRDVSINKTVPYGSHFRKRSACDYNAMSVLIYYALEYWQHTDEIQGSKTH
jgi:hypothetical protein